MPIEIRNGNQVSVLDDAEAWQHAERTALAAPQLTGLATWCWLARLLAAWAHSGHAAEPKREARPKSLEPCGGQHLGPAAVQAATLCIQAVTLRFQVQSRCASG